MTSHKYINPYVLAELLRMPLEIHIDQAEHAKLADELRKAFRELEEKYDVGKKEKAWMYRNGVL